MQVVRFNPILCCYILRNAPHFFVSTSAIPVNRYLTECDFIRENPPSYGQIAFRASIFRNWCFIIETTKKHGKAMSRKAFFAAHCTHRFDQLHWEVARWN